MIQNTFAAFFFFFRLQTQWSLLSSDLGHPSHSSKVSELREENMRLVTEREHFRKVLADREDDIKLIRKQWLREKKNEENKTGNIGSEDNAVPNSDLVRRLEALQIKYDCLKRDLQSLLDEKVDLIQERDAYKCKVHRLNHSMSALLKSGIFPLFTIYIHKYFKDRVGSSLAWVPCTLQRHIK